MESEEEEYEGGAGSDSGQSYSTSLSSESEDSQKGAPVARAREIPREKPQEGGASGESLNSSWRSGPASPPERSGEGESQESGPVSSPPEGGEESGLATPTSGSGETVRRKVTGWARAPSSNVQERGTAGSPGREPGPKARRREGQDSGGSASEESRKEGTPEGRRTQRRKEQRKRWSQARILNWCGWSSESEGT